MVGLEAAIKGADIGVLVLGRLLKWPLIGFDSAGKDFQRFLKTLRSEINETLFSKRLFDTNFV